MNKEQQALLQYNLFLESGDLFEIFPKMKGEWELDKKIFIPQWEANKEFLENESE